MASSSTPNPSQNPSRSAPRAPEASGPEGQESGVRGQGAGRHRGDGAAAAAGAGENPTLWRSIYTRRYSIIAIALTASLAVHAILLVLAALIVFSRAPGPEGQGVEPVEFAIMTDVDLAQLQQEALLDDTPEIPSEEAELPDIELAEDTLDAEVSALTQDLGDVRAQTGAGDVTGEGLGVGGAGAGGASFFGIEATGNRFAYLVDVSGSMGVAGKLDTLKGELNRSLANLMETATFFVCAFNSDAHPLGGSVKWTDATDRGRATARRAISSMESGGATNPAPGFTQIFGLRPRPDAIYFMTDGQFNEDVVQTIERLNGPHEIPIHCITFGESATEAEATMRYIARRSGGTYTHVPGPGGGG